MDEQVHDEFCVGGGCGCPLRSEVPDGRDPKGIEHLCARDLMVRDGPVEECCIEEWMAEEVRLG